MRRTFRGKLVSQLEKTKWFQAIRKGCIEALPNSRAPNEDCSWAGQKQKDHNVMRITKHNGDDLSGMSSMVGLLQEALSTQLSLDHDSAKEKDFVDSVKQVVPDKNSGNCVSTSKSRDVWQPTGDVVRIKMTKEVVKWL